MWSIISISRIQRIMISKGLIQPVFLHVVFKMFCLNRKPIPLILPDAVCTEIFEKVPFKSSRKIGIISLSVLSHHRTCRSGIRRFVRITSFGWSGASNGIPSSQALCSLVAWLCSTPPAFYFQLPAYPHAGSSLTWFCC